VDQFEIDNQLLDHAEIIRVEDDYHLVNSNGWYIKRKNSSVFESNTEINMQYGKPEDYVKDNQGNIWFNNGKSWFLFDSEGKITAFEYFSLFKDIKTINREADTDLFWIVTNDDRLYYYQGDTDLDLSLVRDLFVKNVKSDKRSFRSKSKFNLSHDENNLFVNLSLPDYSGLLNPSFRYKLEGLNNEWSDWTNNSNIDFSYLPPGDYDLKVKSRDNFGRENEYSVLSFKVKTPYWEQPWFYALQISLFAALVFFSTRLNRTKKSNQLLVEGLTVFTIILIIEFLQSVIASYFEFESSPVVSFGIDATVALCIFPLERFLRTFIKEGKAKVSVPPISMKNAKSDQG
jgi:hypothetical protein